MESDMTDEEEVPGLSFSLWQGKYPASNHEAPSGFLLVQRQGHSLCCRTVQSRSSGAKIRLKFSRTSKRLVLLPDGIPSKIGKSSRVTNWAQNGPRYSRYLVGGKITDKYSRLHHFGIVAACISSFLVVHLLPTRRHGSNTSQQWALIRLVSRVNRFPSFVLLLPD